MSQASGEKTARQGQGGGPKTVAGKKRQIAARISNGVHFQSPVLPSGVESHAEWEAHLARLEEALQPVGAWEKALCLPRGIGAMAVLPPDSSRIGHYRKGGPASGE